MSFFKKFGILPVAILAVAILLILLVRPHSKPARTDTGATAATGGSLLSYQRPSAQAAEPETGQTCYNKAQYTDLLTKAQANGLQHLGTGSLSKGGQVEIYAATANNSFAIMSVGTDSTGQFQACLIASGRNLTVQTLQTVPATAPR